LHLPSIPDECATKAQDGDTEEEALAMAEDAIRLVLEDRAARRGETPSDSSTRIRECQDHRSRMTERLPSLKARGAVPALL
jgi:predicted RNase H-like HicB family nuclease